MKLVEPTLEQRLIKVLPQRMIGDKAYDSDRLDEKLKKEWGIEMIAPNRENRVKTQDGRPLRRYKRRWTIERFFAWLGWYRRLLVRHEYHPENFLGFLHLACILILFRHS